MQKIRTYIEIALFSLLIVLMVFSYLPVIQMMKGEEENPLAIYVMLTFFALFIATLKLNILFHSKVIKIAAFWIIVFFLQLELINAIGGYEINVFHEIRPLLIALTALLIGWQMKFTDKVLKFFCILYIVAALFMVLSQVLINIGGFQIVAQYLTDVKNSVGALVATAVVLSAIFAMKKNASRKTVVIFFILTLILIICLLTIRARTAIVVTAVLLLFAAYKKFSYKKQSFIIPLISVILLGIVVYLVLPESAVKYISDSIFFEREDNILSQRGERNEMALHFIGENPWLGNVSGKAGIPWIHNFPLLQLYNFGIIGALPVLVLYIYLFMLLIKKIIKQDIFQLRNFGLIVLMISFGISMAEPTFPFGPGTVNIFNFILFGIVLKYNYDIKIKK
jgi:hypothetical protein